MIKLQQLSLQRGPKVLLDKTSLDIYPQHKIAIIGPNGCGKSSLFALLQGQLQADDGSCFIPKSWRVVSVAQQIDNMQREAIEYVIDGDTTLRQIESEIANTPAEHGKRLAELHDSLEQAGAYDIKSRAGSILNGLGFTQDKHYSPVSDFSGGWQMRLNLARALLCPSDLLLLDEPTNHLDLDAVIWLENWLQQYKGTLILISHDQMFIDSTVSQIVSFEQQKLVSYSGDYSSYEKQKAMRLSLAASEYEKQQKKRQHLESFITRFKAKASKAKQAQSRVKQLEKMQELLPVHQASEFSFSFPPPDKLPNPLIGMEKTQVGYGDTVILDDIALNLVPGSRIGLLGRNGAGKSTLVKLLAGELAPIAGDYHLSQGLDVGYFAQHQVDSLDMQATPLWHIQNLDKQATEQSIRDFLGGFGFHGDSALEPVAPMSGGEKARLVLAILVYQKPNLLLLDEPTNHLDIEVRQALNYALQSYQGAIVLVSHDRFLLEAVCDDFYLVDAGKVEPFDGDLQDYRKWMLQGAKPNAQRDRNQQASAQETATKQPLDRKTQKRMEAEFRQSIKPLKQQLQQAETQMEKLNISLSQFEAALAEADIYAAENKDKLKDILGQQAESKAALEIVELEWMQAAEDIEAAEQAFKQQST
ncbi:ATP-binding cassette domain-containing protein [Agaribacter flavus]|uniref:ATP-binding cassette domain-containing protein n=1 Tax=Agaribacter flavus TaxID=1902781 RepID=A0ABV7FTK2_9ALTE